MRHQRRLAAGLATIVIAAALAACGGGSTPSADTSASSSDTATHPCGFFYTNSSGSRVLGTDDCPPGTISSGSASPTASGTSQAAPTHNYIAVALGGATGSGVGQIDYINPSTGELLYQRTTIDLETFDPSANPNGSIPGATDPGGTTGVFTASTPVVNAPEQRNLANYSFNGNLTKVAGLDAYSGGDTVPAYIDLVSGKVTDVVPPTDHSGITSSPVVTYVAATFDPTSDGLWYMRIDNPEGTTFTVFDPTGTATPYTCAGNFASRYGLYFTLGNHTPQPATDGCAMSPNPGYTPGTQLYAEALPPNINSNYSVQSIRRPDSGKPGGAFTAAPPGSASDSDLFTWQGGTSAPTQIGTLKPIAGLENVGDAQVIRWVDQ